MYIIHPLFTSQIKVAKIQAKLIWHIPSMYFVYKTLVSIVYCKKKQMSIFVTSKRAWNILIAGIDCWLSWCGTKKMCGKCLENVWPLFLGAENTYIFFHFELYDIIRFNLIDEDFNLMTASSVSVQRMNLLIIKMTVMKVYVLTSN